MLKRITSVNLQAHGEVIIDLPKTGLVRFRGENSEGKSIITKTLNECIKCTLHIKENRHALINRGEQSGFLELEKYDGSTLRFNLHRESSMTYYELDVPGENPIRRYISDKNLSELVERFGFHYLKEREFSLNIYNTYDPLIFLTTSLRTNFDVLNSAVVDPVVDRAIDGIDVALKEAETSYKSLDMEARLAEARLANLASYDIETETKKKERLSYLMESISSLETPSIPDFSSVPDITNILLLETSDIYNRIGSLKVVDNSIQDLVTNLEKITNLVECGKSFRLRPVIQSALEVEEHREYLAKQECPTCGRGYTIYHEHIS